MASHWVIAPLFSIHSSQLYSQFIILDITFATLSSLYMSLCLSHWTVYYLRAKTLSYLPYSRLLKLWCCTDNYFPKILCWCLERDAKRLKTYSCFQEPLGLMSDTGSGPVSRRISRPRILSDLWWCQATIFWCCNEQLIYTGNKRKISGYTNWNILRTLRQKIQIQRECYHQ